MKSDRHQPAEVASLSHAGSSGIANWTESTPPQNTFRRDKCSGQPLSRAGYVSIPRLCLLVAVASALAPSVSGGSVQTYGVVIRLSIHQHTGCCKSVPYDRNPFHAGELHQRLPVDIWICDVQVHLHLRGLSCQPTHSWSSWVQC
jgi:hypothetical protein